MKKKKAIVPTLWLLGAVIAVYNAWNYYQDGNTGFVYRHSIICAGFQCDDGAGCGVRIKISALSQNISPNGVKKANRIRKQAAKSI